MVTIDQLVRRAQKAMYRNVALPDGTGTRVMTLAAAAEYVVALQADQLVAASTVLQRLQAADREYNAPSLHSPIDLVALDEQRKGRAEEILKAGTSALVVVNHESRMYSGRKLRPEGFNSCVQAWIAEAARQGIKAEHTGQPDRAYYDKGAKFHAIMAGTVRIVGTDQLLVVVATNYRGRYHVVQARAISEESHAVETMCFNSVAA